jgi:hypothetical protein
MSEAPTVAAVQAQLAIVEALEKEISARDNRPQLLRQASDSDELEVELFLRKELSEVDHDRLARKLKDQEELIERQASQIRELIIGASVLVLIVGYYVVSSK